MAIAGKVAIVPKGEWVNTTAYDKLDLVSYDGGVFLSKKASTGIEPFDGEYWMLLVQDSTSAIADIVNGTTTVGNSLKLNGKSASTYLTTSTNYAGSSTPGGGATKIQYTTVFEGSATESFGTDLIRGDCNDEEVCITGYVGKCHFEEKFPMEDFYQYNDSANYCYITENCYVYFNDNNQTIEVFNDSSSDFVVETIVFYENGAFY